MEQSSSSLLQEIFALESAEDWKNTSEHYESLYSSVHTNEVAIHFAFFCFFDELGVRIIYNYIQTQDSERLTANEKMAIDILFPKGSLIQSYFTWLFS